MLWVARKMEQAYGITKKVVAASQSSGRATTNATETGREFEKGAPTGRSEGGSVVVSESFLVMSLMASGKRIATRGGGQEDQ
jgi:hypothetical protein